MIGLHAIRFRHMRPRAALRLVRLDLDLDLRVVLRMRRQGDEKRSRSNGGGDDRTMHLGNPPGVLPL